MPLFDSPTATQGTPRKATPSMFLAKAEGCRARVMGLSGALLLHLCCRAELKPYGLQVSLDAKFCQLEAVDFSSSPLCLMTPDAVMDCHPLVLSFAYLDANALSQVCRVSKPWKVTARRDAYWEPMVLQDTPLAAA